MRMDSSQNRRRFLATLGVSTAAFAGCVGSLNDSSDPNDNGSDGGNGDDPGSDNSGDDANQQVTPPAITDGELIDGFEGEIEWASMYDHTTVRGHDDALVGDQAMLVESDNKEVTGAFRAFSEGQDFSGKDLSLAVRVDSPKGARVTLEIRAPGTSDKLTSIRSVPSEFDGWLRMDGGYTGKRGEPNLGNVQVLRVYVRPRGGTKGSIRFWLDDLRATQRGDRGKVIISFDDGVESQYTTACPLLKERGWAGVAGVIPDALNVSGRLSMSQLRKMRDAGWDVSAHGGTALPEMNGDERIDHLRSARTYLENRGFEDGAGYYFAPYNRMDLASIKDVREVYDASFIHGAQPSAVPPTADHMVSRINGHDIEGVSEMLDLAAEYNQLIVTLVHGIGDTSNDLNDISKADFEKLLGEIEARNLDVVTVSELMGK